MPSVALAPASGRYLSFAEREETLPRELCDEADALGDLVPDAVTAAVAAEHSCEVVTLDRDFARFESVQHRCPARD